MLWAPVGPAVRAQFATLDDPPPLFHLDWHSVVDPRAWRVRAHGAVEARPVIGRHSRPDALKWPDDRASDARGLSGRSRASSSGVLGGGPFLRELLGGYPRNWEVVPFNAMPPDRFLSTIDFFVYFHHSAMGRGVRRARSSRRWRAARWRSCRRISRRCSATARSMPSPRRSASWCAELHADRRAFLRQSRARLGAGRAALRPRGVRRAPARADRPAAPIAVGGRDATRAASGGSCSCPRTASASAI